MHGSGSRLSVLLYIIHTYIFMYSIYSTIYMLKNIVFLTGKTNRYSFLFLFQMRKTRILCFFLYPRQDLLGLWPRRHGWSDKSVLNGSSQNHCMALLCFYSVQLDHQVSGKAWFILCHFLEKNMRVKPAVHCKGHVIWPRDNPLFS